MDPKHERRYRQAIKSLVHAEASLGEWPRGICPRILLDQVRNTIPFLFAGAQFRAQHLRYLISFDTRIKSGMDPVTLDHDRYFKLCLAAHHGTVASYVPTDVDNQIRFKLWHPTLTDDVLLTMVEVVEDSLGWDPTPVSKRWIYSPLAGDGVLSGHLGEWFSTAAASYAATKKRMPEVASETKALIEAQVERQARCVAELKRLGDGIGLLKAVTMIAHNLGDLDRVIDLWALSSDDPLRLSVYKAGHGGGRWPPLRRAGDLNKSLMAVHSHRHFPLRGIKALRKSASLLLPINPFLDDWGRAVARQLSPEEVGEVVVGLVHGYFRLEDPGYARALSGIEDAFIGGASELSLYIPARVERALRSGPIRTLTAVTQRRFEEHMGRRALQAFK